MNTHLLSLLQFWTKISFNFLIRSGKSTFFLSIMVVSAVAALIFLSALTVGVHDAMLRNTVGLFSGHITGYGLNESITAGQLAEKGIDGVLKRKYISGTLEKDTISRAITLCLINPPHEQSLTALHTKIQQGRYPQSGGREILISRITASELKAEIGTVLKFQNNPENTTIFLTVSGIFNTSIDNFDWGNAFATLDIVTDKNIPWTAAVFISAGTKTGDALSALQEKWKGQATFESWETTMPDLRQLIDLEYISMAIVIVLVFAVVAIGIGCSFIIFIIRNIREYGIMKAMGVTNRELAALIVVKVLIMNAAASGAGMLLGIIAVEFVTMIGGIDISSFTSHNQYFTVSGIILPRLTTFSFFTPPATALIFSLLASLWPAILLAQKRTADILRSI
ncbi:MAG: FtsX-like permease family protein [Desulfopila sp.]|jgi:ABC-type lipoprotein release transport system permease subunit|nr:FtsX-like permease family protein [Desulfopila sp.]